MTLKLSPRNWQQIKNVRRKALISSDSKKKY